MYNDSRQARRRNILWDDAHFLETLPEGVKTRNPFDIRPLGKISGFYIAPRRHRCEFDSDHRIWSQPVPALTF